MSIWFFVIPFAIAAALPGPAQAALVGRVLVRGAAASFPFIAGMVAGNALWLLATAGTSLRSCFHRNKMAGSGLSALHGMEALECPIGILI